MLDASTNLVIPGEVIQHEVVEATDAEPRTRLQVIRDLTKTLPKNEFGMQTFFYRPDLIPEDFDDLSPRDKTDILNTATIPIQFREGFPALEDGTPIWGPLPYESQKDYSTFEKYLELANTAGVRRIDLLVNELPGISRDTLMQLHTYHYWGLRSRALDLFQVAAAQKMRERRILSMSDRHFLEAEKLFGHVLKYFERTDEEGNPAFLRELSPKSAMDMVDKLYKMQRVAVGLPAHGHANGSDDGETPKNAGFEMVLRTIAKRSGDTVQSNSQNVVDMLSGDSEMAAMAQELIVRINSNGKERKIEQVAHNPKSIAEEISG